MAQIGVRSFPRRGACARICAFVGTIIVSPLAAAAPFVGPSRADVLKRLRARSVKEKLPIILGHGEPEAIIRLEGGNWVMRRLESDAATLREIERRQIAAGYYVPEHRFGSLVPGSVLLQHSDLRSFVSGLQAIEWTYGP